MQLNTLHRCYIRLLSICMVLLCPQTLSGPIKLHTICSKPKSSCHTRQWHWLNMAIPQPKDKQSTAQSPLFNMTSQALTFTDQAIHWPAVASHRRLLPQGLRCPSCPSYWPKWCASWEPRRQSLHRTAPDPPGRAAPGWALLEALGSHSSYLKESSEREERDKETL